MKVRMDATNGAINVDESSLSWESALKDLTGYLVCPEGEPSPDPAAIDRLAEFFGCQTARAGRSVTVAVDRLLTETEASGGRVPMAAIVAVVRGFEEYGPSGPFSPGPVPNPLSDHVTRLAALRRINQAATKSLDLDAMLQTVVTVVRDTMNCDSCSIFLVDETNSTLVLRASVGLNPQANGRVFLPLGVGITGQAALIRQIVAVPDATTHPNYVDYPLVGDQRYSSHVSVPLALSSPDRLVGVLNILSLDRREFDQDDLNFLETAAGEMAIAIENAQLYSQTDAELQRRIQQLSTLQQMSRLVASTLDLPKLLNLICVQASDLSHAAGVEIYRMRRNDVERLELLARHSPTATCSFDSVNADVRGVVDDVMRSLATIWRSVGDPELGLFVHAFPMLTGRRAVGALCVFHTVRPPDDHEAGALLDAFCDAAAIAIENADLYEEARRGYVRTSTLLQEMHHRVRNNLQTVAALLSMQARHTPDPATAAPLREAVTRIQSIAAIHDILSGGNLRETTVDVIAKHVADDAVSNLVDPGLKVQFRIEPSVVVVNSKEATVLALLINEFVMNAIGHGFAGRTRGEIVVRSSIEDGRSAIEVVDDGVGIDEGFSLETSRRLGLIIARTLVETDLRGDLKLVRRPEGGTVVRVTFPSSVTEAPTGTELST